MTKSSPKAASEQAPRVLRYIGKDPRAVDPYWDFEHLPGEPYDGRALRLWRLRVFVSKPARARLWMARSVVTPEASTEGSAHQAIPAMEHILRFGGGPEREATSYEPIERSVVDVSPPSTTFVVNLTGLEPGKFVVRASVIGAQQQAREMSFQIVRRDHYAYAETPPGKAPVVRSHTGLQHSPRGEGGLRVVRYRWRVERWGWERGVYTRKGESQAVAEVVPGGGAPRWDFMDDVASSANASEPRREWPSYLAEVGLAPPTLLGLRIR